MRKCFTKMAAIGLVVTMVCGCFGACGKHISDKKEDIKEEKSEPVTLTVYSELSGVGGEQGGWGGKVLLDKFNVILEIKCSDEGVFDEGIETGNLGDILIFGGETTYVEALSKGILYDWNKGNLLQKYGTYIYENMGAALEMNRNITSSFTGGDSDTLYGFGHNIAYSIDDHEQLFYTWDIRWDLYKQLNCPKVNTLDDLVNVLADMQKLNPTDFYGNPTYAASLWTDWDENNVFWAKSLASAYYGYDELGMGLYDVKSGNYYEPLKEDGPYIEMLRFLNKLYQKGLLDPASRTQTYEGAASKLMADGALWSIFSYAGNMTYNIEDNIKNNKAMYPLKPENATPIVYGYSVEGGHRMWAIGANTEHPELCMQIINWFATPEGYMTYLYGPKEICWNYDDEGYTYLTELGKKAIHDRRTPMEGEYACLGTFNDGCYMFNNTIWTMGATNPDSNGESYNRESWKSEQEAPQCDTEANWREHNDVSSAYDYFESNKYVVAPGIRFAYEKERGELSSVWEAVTAIIKNSSWDAIYAENDAHFNQIISDMISDAKAKGYDQCVEWDTTQAALRHTEEERVRASATK